MKKLLLFSYLLFLALYSSSQVSKIINVETAGTLSSLLSSEELNTITDLMVSGILNQNDFITMRDNMPALSNIDISGVDISIIPNDAFMDKKSMKSIILSNKITFIGINSFLRCTNLNSVSFVNPSSLSMIGMGAFSSCTSLTNFMFPASLQTLGIGAFTNSSVFFNVDANNQYFSSTDGVLFNENKSELIQCPITKTGSYVIPSSVTTIKQGAFFLCTNLVSIRIPSAVKTIESSAFGELGADIIVDENNPNYSSSEGILFNKNKTELIKCPTTKTGKYIIPSSVNTIDPTAFGFCNDLTSITIPSSVNSIGTDAFNPCEGLKEIYIEVPNPNTIALGQSVIFGVDRWSCVLIVPVGSSDLYRQTENESWRRFINIIEAQKIVEMPKATVTLGLAGGLSKIFTSEELANITSISLNGTIDARDFKTMRDLMPALAEVDISGATIVEYTGTEGTAGTNSITYPANEIPQWAFCTPSLVGKPGLTSFRLPISITGIGSYSFVYCTGLSTVTIPKYVISLGRSAFNGCTGITSVNFESPSSVADIGIYAFRACSFESITIPLSVNTIRDGSFMYCPNLTTVSFESSSILTEIGVNAFRECPKLSSIIIPSKVTKINNYAFYKCGNLTSVILDSPSSVTDIGYAAFYECTKLNSFSIPAILQTIGDFAFNKCSNITSFNLPEVTEIIGKVAFLGTNAYVTVVPDNPNYSSLDGVLYDKNKAQLIYCPPPKTGGFTVPATVTKIAEDAFYKCSGLTNIGLPSGLTTLEDWAFEECHGLTTISIPASVNSIGNQVFYNCTGLTSIFANNPTPVDLSANKEVFFGIDKVGCTLYVPAASVNLYKIADQWQDFVNIVGLNNRAPLASAGSDQNIAEGTIVTLDGSFSSDPDGDLISYKWTASAGITLSSESVQKPTFIAPNVTVDTDYTFTLVVSDGTVDSAPDQIVVTVKNVNKVPVADAGTDQTVDEGTTVTLDGSQSFDPDGDVLIYKWTAPAGITLSSASAQKPTFTAPSVSSNTDYTFSLVVNDGTVDSQPDQVVVNIKNQNQPPVANAGADQTVNEGATVTLNGSQSSDPDGDPLNYHWTAPDGITLSSISVQKPTFTAPAVTSDTPYIFTLGVNDGTVDSQPDQVVVTVKNVNQQPTANAGSDQMVNEGTTVTIDGSQSSDPDGDALTYQWTAPSGIVLSDATIANPTFIAPKVTADTSYIFTLVVNDGSQSSTSSDVTVNVKNVLPVINLLSEVNNAPLAPATIVYQLFKKSGTLFEEKELTPVYNGDVTSFYLEQGEWIFLVSPADLSSFTPTYLGDVTSWASAEIINVPEEGVISGTITCSMANSLPTGVGEISGYVYIEDGAKSVSLIQTPLDGGNPVSGALIQLFKKGGKNPVSSCFTDANGYYQFGKIEISEYEIVVDLPGFTQSDRLAAVLSESIPSTILYIAVNTATQLITNTGMWNLLQAKIYPNPFRNSIIIESGASINHSAIISIYDARGSLVFQREVNNPLSSFDLSEFVAGLYLINIATGNNIQTRVLIKQ